MDYYFLLDFQLESVVDFHKKQIRAVPVHQIQLFGLHQTIQGTNVSGGYRTAFQTRRPVQ